MSLVPFFRRRIAPVVLVGYLLTATLSGLFHNHGGSCCGPSGCSIPAENGAIAGFASENEQAPRHEHGQNAQCHHGHGHHGHPHHHGPARHKESSGRSAPDKQPGCPGPLRHDDCAACQFLAQQSLAAPLFHFELFVAMAPQVSETVETWIPAEVPAAHPARGPPARA